VFLTNSQVQSALNVDKVIVAIREAFTRDFHSTLEMPVRSRLDMGASILLLMPCYDSFLNAAGVKTVTVNPESGVNAIYALIDPGTGRALAVMEANYLTDLRTAATSAVATDLLARKDVQVLGIFGTGRQATIHFTVLHQVRAFGRFLVCGSRYSRIAEFCKRMKQECGIEIEAVDAETCARESDVLCTCTTWPQPLFDGGLLRPGTHLNLVGAFQPHTREVDTETVRRARVVVDTYEGSLAEAGELLIPFQSGVITRDHVVADLHEVASGKKHVRTTADDITLFKSVGCALEDLVTAQLVLEELAAAE
jgi:alanine dehydrogenase